MKRQIDRITRASISNENRKILIAKAVCMIHSKSKEYGNIAFDQNCRNNRYSQAESGDDDKGQVRTIIIEIKIK